MHVFGITGWKNSGKTTLTRLLVEHLIARGLRVSTIKHAHHQFDIDHPGTDSYLHRKAGAHEVLIASANRWALMHENRNQPEPTLDDLLAHLQPVDIVLVEGFKQASHPKIQVVRPTHNNEQLPASVTHVVALASDEAVNPADYQCSGPVLDLNNITQIADFILEYCQLTPAN